MKINNIESHLTHTETKEHMNSTLFFLIFGTVSYKISWTNFEHLILLLQE